MRKTIVERLAGVFFKVEAGNADTIGLATILNINPAARCQRIRNRPFTDTRQDIGRATRWWFKPSAFAMACGWIAAAVR